MFRLIVTFASIFQSDRNMFRALLKSVWKVTRAGGPRADHRTPTNWFVSEVLIEGIKKSVPSFLRASCIALKWKIVLRKRHRRFANCIDKPYMAAVERRLRSSSLIIFRPSRRALLALCNCPVDTVAWAINHQRRCTHNTFPRRTIKLNALVH